MKLELSSRFLLITLALCLAFILFRGFYFTESITSFLREHLWDAIF